jgi:hypothetical protein
MQIIVDIGYANVYIGHMEETSMFSKRLTLEQKATNASERRLRAALAAIDKKYDIKK